MAKIETDIGVNVGIDNAPVPQDGNITTATSQIVGKNSWQELADIFATINPAIRDLTQKNIELKAEKDFELGKAKINGMTLAEAETAHKQGFPSIMNGWAKYGAHKQYAVNSVDSMISSFKDDYLNKRHEPNYDWRSHYDEYSSKFLASVEGDEVFASAFNEQTAQLRKWLNVKEFEKQEDKLKYTVIANASKQIQSIPEQVEQALEVAFYEANPPMTLGKNYQERKSQFFRDNMSQTYLDMFNTIKENKNPALSLSEFDDIVISEAELHASLDGRFSAEFIDILTQPRPDGTPAIIHVTKHKDRVVALVDKLKESIQLQIDSQNWAIGNLADKSKTERIEIGTATFNKEFNRLINTPGVTKYEAFMGATHTLMNNGMKRNEALKPIVDLFEKPLSSQYTSDAKLALDVYALLDKNGLTGIYFKENDKNKYDFFIAHTKIMAGQDPRDVIMEIGKMKSKTSERYSLSSDDKKKLQAWEGNMANPQNKELAEMVAEYFKNTSDDIDGNHLEQAEEFVNKHYTLINGRYVSNYKLQAFGIKPEEHDLFKQTAIEVLKEKLNVERNVIEESDIVGFLWDETNLEVGQMFGSEEKGIDLNDYELIVNDADDMLYFKTNDGISVDVPSTVTYKDGQSAYLAVPITKVRELVLAKQKKAQIKQDKEDAERLEKKTKRNEKRRKRQKILEETSPFGQGEIYKF